jgi:predicted transcriptional regulator
MSMAQEIDGRKVTEADIERLSRQAERGYPVEQLRRRGRRPAGNGPGNVVTVRLDADLRQAIDARAVRDHKNDSEVIRDALRAWL